MDRMQRGVGWDLALQGEPISLHGEGGIGGGFWPELLGGSVCPEKLGLSQWGEMQGASWWAQGGRVGVGLGTFSTSVCAATLCALLSSF